MTFVTKLSLESGDRAALDGVVSDIKETCRRKGAQMKGPHSEPPADQSVPLYSQLGGEQSEKTGSWHYTVYRRRLELHGHDDLARAIMERDFPESVHVEAELEQVKPLGSS
ncbi:uS10/mL48 family ribosomal protein [Halobacterium bonnevillei]|jgi:small subunit ribosomal protein S10|uniref:Small ribosomal subunit protein uS10 n=1 Tax=Halobacterium bonnevillei TaxID=2692200 RepID=A0A6B0SIR8_9EURY|nr:uS10/mL48 family ribosomal protein [Halobacterium bonnevillei]MXR21565.1 30S ribosomal protein S10 [Halobacterium bonnevillei]